MNFKGFVFSLLILTANSCDDILVENITDRQIILLSPASNAILDQDTVTFWWDPVGGAEGYEFHLVSPSFDNIQQVWVDSITADNLISIGSLPNGSYEWEVLAYNSGYSTDYYNSYFSIDTTQQIDVIDISGELIEVIAPSNNLETTLAEITFWWEEIEGAEEYELRLVSPSFSLVENVLIDSVLVDNMLKVSELASGSYEWEVRGLNDSSNTSFNRASFTINEEEETEDISNDVIVLLSPSEGLETIQTELTFWWEELDGASQYEINIVSPSFEDVQTVLADRILEDNAIDIQAIPIGTYEWQVRGLNEKSQTTFSRSSFAVVELNEVVDISGSVVHLLAPGDSLETALSDFTFWWDEVSGASSYEVVVVSPSFEKIETVVLISEIMENELEVSLDSGTYQWGVKGINEEFETQRNIRSLFIDP